MNGCLFGNKCNNCYHVGFEASLILQLQDFSMKKKNEEAVGKLLESNKVRRVCASLRK